MINSLSVDNWQDQDNPSIKTQKVRSDIPSMNDQQTLQFLGQADSAIMVLGILAQEAKMPPVITTYDTKEDFDWYVSGQVNTDSFRGKYIAIWRKQIIGEGETATEVERIAKAYYGDECRPAIIYIPEDSDAIL